MEETTLLQTARFSVTEVSRPGQPTKAVVRHPGAVAIIPLLSDGRICLIKNYRVAAGKSLIEIPAGTLELDGDPAITAVRELKEETGYSSETWREIAPPFFVSPGIMDERMYLFLATDLSEGEPEREAGEEIENLVVPFQDALEMVRNGEICDAKTIVGLLTYHTFVRGAE